jgi:hypothetical protein
MPGFPTGPYVCAALLCERVLIEQDGVSSYIRVVDTFVRAVDKQQVAGAAFPAQMVNVTLVLNLKPGEAKGSFMIGLRLEKPSGLQKPIGDLNVHFAGGANSGANVHAGLELELDEEGLWWIDVLGGDEQVLLTRIPAELRIQRVSSNPQAP